MAKSILDKYKSIDQTKISKEAKTILLKIKVKTKNFKETTPETNKVFNAFYSKLEQSKPQAIKGYKEPAKSAPKPTSKGSSKKLTPAQLLKEAKKRRANQGISTSKSDIEKDAARPAKPKGYRITDGTHYPYVKGNKYWEGRENRLDRKQPPKKYPKLEHGGMMAKGGELESGVYRVGKPTKVSPNLYEQKIVEIFENGDIATASDYGRKLTDFKVQSYPIITKEELDAQYKMAHGGYMAKGGEVTPYIVWVSKDGNKREFYGEYKSMRAAIMKMNNLWETGEYEAMGNKPKKMYEKEGFYAKGGGVYSSDSLYILTISKDGNMVGHEPFRAKNMKEAREMAEDMEEKYKSKFGGDLSFSLKEAMADGGVVGQGFLIRDMREKLNRMFPDTFGFTVGNVSKEGNKTINSAALIVDSNDPYRGLEDKDIQSKLFFPQYKRDHDINFRVMQGGENTYFYFVLESENGDQYIGQFGFKDRGDVSADYVTRFIAFLMEQYGLPFEVKHEVMAKGGTIGEPHRIHIGG